MDDAHAQRHATVLAHLNGTLHEDMLHAVQGVWSMLEHASVDGEAHARAVRARMFWESLTPGAAGAAPGTIVSDLVASWDEAQDEAGDELLDEAGDWSASEAA